MCLLYTLSCAWASVLDPDLVRSIFKSLPGSRARSIFDVQIRIHQVKFCYKKFTVCVNFLRIFTLHIKKKWYVKQIICLKGL